MSTTNFLGEHSVILAEQEVTYGTDPIPTKIVNAILAQDLSIEPTTKSFKRGPVGLGDGFGPLTDIRIGEKFKITFKTELKNGQTTLGTPPETGCLYRACKMGETILAVTSVTYAPITNINPDSVTIWAYLGQGTSNASLLFKATGCRGNFNIEGVAGEPAYVSFEMEGFYAAPTDSTIFGDATYVTAQPPILQSGVFTFDSQSIVTDSFKLNRGNAMSDRKDANSANGLLSIISTKSEPQLELAPEAVDLATWNAYTKAISTSVLAFSGKVGTVSKNRCTITASQCEITEIPKTDVREGILIHPLKINLRDSATGNDSFSLLFD